MKAQLLTGSKQEIAQQVAGLEGDVREAIVFIEEPQDAPPASGAKPADLFMEMAPYMVHVGTSDASRAAVYSRLPGE